MEYLDQRNMRVQYQSPISYSSRVLSKNEVFADKQINRQIDRHTDKNNMPPSSRWGHIKH